MVWIDPVKIISVVYKCNNLWKFYIRLSVTHKDLFAILS